MLSLVILVIISANVILWSYQMNQLDWEKTQENISVVNVTRVIETWSYNPSGFALGGSTSNVSGSVSDLTSDDGVYMTFRSYYSGTDTSDFVDQTCDLYPPSAIGAHSNFTAQQTGPDALYDTLTESGGSIEDYVDNNTSDVDNSTDVGSHSNFENERLKDGIYDTLTESGAVGEIIRDGVTQGQDVSATVTFSHTLGYSSGNNRLVVVAAGFEHSSGDINIGSATYNGQSMTKIVQATTGGSSYAASVALFYLLDSGLPSSSGSYSVVVTADSDPNCDLWACAVSYIGVKQEAPDDYDSDFSGSSTTMTSNLICDEDGSMLVQASVVGNIGSFTPSSGTTEVIEDSDINSASAVFNEKLDQDLGTRDLGCTQGAMNRGAWVGACWAPAGGDADYDLNIEVQFTSVIDFLETEKLCIYMGTMGAEDLNVSYWTGSSWIELDSDLTASSWNNYTVSLTSSTFTIRFETETAIGDDTADEYQVDAVLLCVEGAGSKEDSVDADDSNVDDSVDVGTLSSFDNMKTKDGMATLTEDDVGGTVWLWQEDTSGYGSTSSYETYQFWNSWTTNSTTSGTVTKIGIYVFADPGNSPQVKLGIYDDSGGSPNNLLGETNAATITGAGWLDLDIVGGGVSISASTTYHVAHITDIAPTTQWRYLKSSTPVSDYRNGRVWPNLFDPAGATSKSGSYRYGAHRVGYDEPPNYQLDQEVQWTDVPYLLPNENLSIYGGTMGDEDIKVDVWNGTDWENVFTDLSSGWNNASITNWLTSSNFTIRFKGGNETGDPSQDTWNVDVALIHIWNTVENYELDLEVQWASVDYDETNEELCIKTGTFSGSEDLQVKVRSGGSWVWVMNLTANQWNNVSVTSYLTGSTFTIQFLGGTETSDSTQDNWDIDVTLLHVWSDQYAMEVEFSGSSNTEDWTRLNWTIDSAWTIGSADVTLQLYNYTLDGYPTSGNGYMNYTSSATANTDETKNQIISVNPTSCRNATGYWKMKVKGVKTTDTQFDFKADWIEYKAIKAGGTSFTFENTGSLTCHLVSLWIINSTVHQRHDIDVFINSGETYTYIRDDIDLPDGQCTVKVVTERGNTRVYSII